MRFGWQIAMPLAVVLAAMRPALEGRAGEAKPGAGQPAKVDFDKHVAPLLAKYCLDCHSGKKPKGGLGLDAYANEAAAQKKPELWDAVAERLTLKEMPPAKKAQPTPEERKTILGWIEAHRSGSQCAFAKDPGRPTIRRLNRAEYDNTIRDLFGANSHPAQGFPADDVGYGFDSIGDVLSMPPILMEKYLAAAERSVGEALAKPELRKRLVIVEPGPSLPPIEAARRVLIPFAERAYRRPLKEEETNRLLKLFQTAQKNGDSFDSSIGLAVEAVLASPHFLFRVELDSEPNNPGSAHAVNDFELASRLSYFLWSSMPDAELFDLAKKGTLHKNEILEGQVKRMLKDAKAHALTENFADQWLQIRRLASANPDPGRFKGANEALKADMARETELFFEAIVTEDRSILEFLDADYTFLNERLAKLYGIEGIKGNEFRKVKLTTDQRGGVLTMASILTITSNPTRTSPVKRGKWILETLLGTPPPPPPPEAGELSEKKAIVESASLRQRMEQHRADPNCASCHQKLDPLGFGFENYDGIGAWRTKDGKFDIDPAGVLPDGRAFKGPKELKAILKTKDQEFRKCLVDRLLTYALGRGLESYDKCAVEQIADYVKKEDNRFSSLVLGVVKSDSFQKRRGQAVK